MSFKVGVTSDILDAKGEPVFGREPLKAFDVPGLELEWLPKGIREITSEHAAKYDALYVNSPRVPAAAVAGKDLRLKVVSRHGVGYDSVDVPAMTARSELFPVPLRPMSPMRSPDSMENAARSSSGKSP